MSRQVPFVIMVDIDSEKLYIDDDIFDAKFGKHEGVYDVDPEWGEEYGLWMPDKEGKLYKEALRILNKKAEVEKE
jgi:hypothetical protein